MKVCLSFQFVVFFWTYEFTVIDWYLQEQWWRTEMPFWECDCYCHWLSPRFIRLWHDSNKSWLCNFKLLPCAYGCRYGDCGVWVSLLPVTKLLGPRGVNVQYFVRHAPLLPRWGRACSSWRKANSVLLLVLWEHFTLLFVICHVEN